MSTRQRRTAQAMGILALALSLAAVTLMVPTGATQVAPGAGAGHFTAQTFVPTTVPLPASDEEPAPTF